MSKSMSNDNFNNNKDMATGIDHQEAVIEGNQKM